MTTTKFYIMHYKKNAERLSRLKPILDKLGIEAEWCTEYDKDELTPEDISRYYTPDIDLFKERTAGMYEEVDYDGYDGTTMGHLSLCIKHLKCMEDLASSEYDNGVFLEDDVIFHYGKSALIDCIEVAEEISWDGLFFGGGFTHNLIANRVYGTYKSLLLVDHPATNCTSSFALTKEASKKILGSFNTVCTSIDWELNHHFRINNLKIWHTNPYVCGQLSMSGVYKCTL